MPVLVSEPLQETADELPKVGTAGQTPDMYLQQNQQEAHWYLELQ